MDPILLVLVFLASFFGALASFFGALAILIGRK